jgi:uncharacterized protein (DUF433 family)
MPSMIAERNVEPWRRRLYLPAYRVADAARYSRAATQTVAYWHHRSGTLGPALPGRTKRQPLSYLELVEVAFVATFRALGVSLQRIRRARAYAAQVLNAEYPFAEHAWLTEGHHVMLDLRQVDDDASFDSLIMGDVDGQIAFRGMVGDRFAQFDYEDSLALTWHVVRRGNPVVIDPRVSFGAPTVRGIPTWILKGRWNAGESVPDIEDDFGLSEEEIRHGLSFEGIDLAA